MGWKNGMALSGVLLTACGGSIPASSCLTVAQLYPICVEDYQRDGLKEGSETERKVLLTNEWAVETCGVVNDCVR